MKQARFNILWLSLVAFISCNSNVGKEKTDNNLHDQLIGEWRNMTVHIELNSFKNTAKDTTIETSEANWEQQLKIRPIRTFFNPSGDFHSEYYNLKDSLVRRPTGTWVVKADTLIMYYQKPDIDTLRIGLSIDKGIGRFETMLDFDGDGKRDDHYIGTQRKQ